MNMNSLLSVALQMTEGEAQLNHFALKYKLLVRSNQIAFEELRRLKCL
ncbi:hypothetical protein Psal071_02847 [Piscirickettsia salmonis]|uniref:Uncharacterized protein n=1 Tax=Piscirickettsia salmonis TaxID=1238 RepID=A0A9Q6LLS8_PISSA|nr:hypothetical protein [Piscirickettsia salmonis]QGN96214.1 hypothetical protein Psal006a_02845 [Piscirickettsia salmonis]QGO07157.1 hypothetical protein Psal009_03095 [Piscirickettsia salmonis]QGO35484.1 hypothetical protein Psal028_02847 [Piscirickettsia salmonis]QGO39103.1 hypothetical protein Psal040_02856 [Piscirickettsia salmonis]QGO42717.1 hypothetical protein Psal041_02844 [Piscirickettsia salmonis]